MPVLIRRPEPPLARLVQAIIYRSGGQPQASVEKILPSAETGLWVNLNRDAFRSFDDSGRASEVPGAMLAGPTSRACVIEFEQGHAHVSVAFALGGASSLLGVPLEVARDELVPLEVLWGRSGRVLRERLLEARTPGDALDVMEAVLLRHLTDAVAPDPGVIAAAEGLSRCREVRVGEVARDLGFLPRTLRRRFAAQVGLTPKRFAMVQRMRRVTRDLDGQRQVDWAAVAARHGYADQPHLADEFRVLAGVTPNEYLRSRIDGPTHLRVPGLNSDGDVENP